VLTLALGEWTSHWPASPQTNDLNIAVWKEEKAEPAKFEAEQPTKSTD